MVSAAETKKRRERLARLLQDDPDISDRAAGVRLGAHHSTIARDRLALAEREDVHRPPAPPEGNTRALTHGATSELTLAPLRQGFATDVARRWPWLDDIRQAIVADRLARLELARRWLDEQHALGLDRDGLGEPFPIVDRVERWATRTEQIVGDLEAEARERSRGPGSFSAVVAEIAAEGDQDEETSE